MTEVIFQPLPTANVQELRRGSPDAYGKAAERTVSDDGGNPCRHCLDFVPKGNEMLVLAYRPFDDLQPYAETGPIFLCGDDCAAWSGEGVPLVFSGGNSFLLKGYTDDQRINYGTGKIVAQAELMTYAQSLLDRDDIAFVDVRSATNNCFQARIVRSGH
jgi:hypothetical protein